MAKIRDYLAPFKANKFDAKQAVDEATVANQKVSDTAAADRKSEAAFAAVLKKKGSAYEPDDDGDGNILEYYSDNGMTVSIATLYGPDSEVEDDGTLPPPPDPDPEPTPEPEPEPNPSPTPTPTPSPAPLPEPAPEPAPDVPPADSTLA